MDGNEAVLRRWVEALNRQQPVVAETFAEDARTHLEGHPEVRARDSFGQTIAGFFAAFPDLRFTTDGLTILGDLAASRWTARGTRCGPLPGIAPTGRAVEFREMIIDRFVGGQIAERWEQYDRLGLLQQLGAVPAPGRAPPAAAPVPVAARSLSRYRSQ